MAKLLWAIAFCCCFAMGNAQRTTILFNDHWDFYPGEDVLKAKSGDWQAITLPHTWNRDAYTRMDYQRGQCWYRKTFGRPQQKTKKHYLRFEAINSYAEVYLNGHLLATHSGGYSAFHVLLPQALLRNKNEIRVLVDNRNENIPPLSGDFTIFGGIYRNVQWITVPHTHFDLDNHGSMGVFISTPVVNEQSARIQINGAICNAGKKPVKLELEILHQNKTVISRQLMLSDGQWQLKDIEIKNPQLWSPNHPHLYTARLRLLQNNVLLDELQFPFGLRWFSADVQNGFMLNGRPLKLMGTNRHQDKAPFGIAVPDSVHRQDMQLIKNMGANFVRLAHYQQSDEVLKACDELGLLVWEEISIVDIIAPNDSFTRNAQSQLAEMIRQHYNHPSIVFWGYMNEAFQQLYYRIPKTEQKHFCALTAALARQLEARLKQEDSSRLSVMACAGSTLYNDAGLAHITDVVGWNLYQGWYGNNLADFEKYVDDQISRNPARPIIISEYGAGSDKRLHSLLPEIFDFSIEYQQKYLEHYLPQILQRNFVIGAAQWNFIDFNVASRQESMPRTNNKGLLYNDRSPKDVYYYFMAMLKKDSAMVWIASRDWAERQVTCDSADVQLPIKIYSNAAQVSLSVNGHSIEPQQLSNCTAILLARMPAGKNILVARAYQEGQLVATDSMELTVTISPKTIPQLPAHKVAIAVNVGSNCSFYDAENSITWKADQAYTAGSWGYTDGSIYRASPGRIGTTAEIKGTAHTPLFQTMRQDLSSYRFDAAPGWYQLELCFADVYKAPLKNTYDLNTTIADTEGLNAFDISINDSMVLPRFAPFLLQGNHSALRKTFRFYHTGNAIHVQLKKRSGHTFLNAIRLTGLQQ